MRRQARGQIFAEYAILIGIAAAALIGMQAYFKRGIQSGIKVAADQMGAPTDARCVAYSDRGECLQREGMMDVDFRLIWRVKGHSDLNAATTSSRTVELQGQGKERHVANDETENQGLASLAGFGERNQ